jgi:hypothetical protein
MRKLLLFVGFEGLQVAADYLLVEDGGDGLLGQLVEAFRAATQFF